MSSADTLLAACSELASTKEWRELRRVVDDRRQEASTVPTVITLYAEALLRTGEPQGAAQWLEDRKQLLQLSGDHVAVRRALTLAGAASLERGELDAAKATFEHLLSFGRSAKDELLVARSANNLAVIATIRGRYAEALGLHAVALLTYQRLGNVKGIAESHHNTAILQRKLNRLDEADENERRAAEFATEINNEHLVALTLVGRAEIAMLRGDSAVADATARRAARELGAVPDPARQADALRLCGVAQMALGRIDQACDTLDAAIELADLHGSALIEAESRWARAQAAVARGEPDTPHYQAERAAAIFRQINAPEELATVTAWLARLSHPSS